MKSDPLVSVIVTTYNRKELLKETILSIMNQTYKNFELIVVDNFSDYNLLSHIQSFNDDRLRPFQNANNGIIAVNRNFAINKAMGEYIAFCDDDDLWLPQKLEKQIKFMDQWGCYFSSTARIMIDINGNPTTLKFKNRLTELLFSRSNYKNLFYSSQIYTSSVMIKRDLLDGLRFDDDPLLVAVEDYGLWLQLLRKNEDAYKKLDEKLILYRIGGSSSDWKKQQVRVLYCLIKHINQHSDFSLYTRLMYVLVYNMFKSIFQILVPKSKSSQY